MTYASFGGGGSHTNSVSLHHSTYLSGNLLPKKQQLSVKVHKERSFFDHAGFDATIDCVICKYDEQVVTCQSIITATEPCCTSL